MNNETHDNQNSANLDALRAHIDAIDDEIVKLLNTRAEIILKVRALKRETGMPNHDPEREKALIQALIDGSQGPLPQATIRHIYEHILHHMREFEED
jgi:chorismate mutase